MKTARTAVAPRAHLLAVALSIALAAPAIAQETSATGPDPAADPAAEPSTLDGIVVTGSRIKRASIEGPSPVVVISSEQIQREGFVTVSDALETLTQASGFIENDLVGALGGFTPNGSPINLRGLGPNRTLLLINGRRATDYPFPYGGQSNFQNFGNIPAAAVDRVEILSGGASAIYGSDAVAGVVNVVLKTDFSGDRLRLRAGTTTEGGGDFGSLQWVGGRTGDRWSLTYAFEYFADEPLWGFQRDFMDSPLDNPDPPSIGAQPTAIMRLWRTPLGAGAYYAPPAGACEQFGDEAERYTFRTTSASTGEAVVLGEGCGSWRDLGYQTITNGNDDLSAYLYGTWRFSDSLEGWASLQGWDSTAKLANATQFVYGPHIDGLGTLQTWYDPQFGENMNVRRIFTPQEIGGIENLMQRFEERSFDFALGLRGTIAGRFDWDASIGRAEYDSQRFRPRLVGQAVSDYYFGPLLGVRNGVPIYELDLDRYHAALTPAQYAAMSTTVLYDANSWVNQASFSISGDLFELPAGAIGVAAVVEASSQGYAVDTDQRILPDVREIYNLTGTSGGGERDRYAVGVEFSVPLLASLRANLAGRYDKYDDVTNVDDARTWNAGLEWRPFDRLLVRGSYATSFKAPDMHYVFNEGSGGFSTVIDYYRCLSSGGTPNTSSCPSNDPDYVYSVFATSRGEPTLREETGDSWGAGFVWDIADGLSASLDYYDITLEDAVTTLSSAYIIEAEGGCRTGLGRNRQPYPYALDSAFCQEILARVTRIPAPGEPSDRVDEIRSGPVNQSTRRVTGLDANLRWRFDGGRWGAFATELSWSHTLRHQRQVFATDAVEEDWRDDKTNFDFRSRIRGSVNWSRDDWNVNVFATRYGSLPNWEETGRIAPYILWNANVGKHVAPDLRLSFFVNNIFNKFHPRDDSFDTYPFFYYSYSPVGREVSAQIEYSFD